MFDQAEQVRGGRVEQQLEQQLQRGRVSRLPTLFVRSVSPVCCLYLDVCDISSHFYKFRRLQTRMYTYFISISVCAKDKRKITGVTVVNQYSEYFVYFI